MSVISSEISGNSTLRGGGGIRGSSSSVLTVISSTISNNSADRDGGGIGTRGEVTLTGSTISENSSRRSGGGISGGNVMVTLSTISGNSARGGGGLHANGDLSVASSTIAGNSATVLGGGIWGDQNATVTIEDSIVAGNTVPPGTSASEPDLRIESGGTLDLRYSLIGDNSGTGLAEAPVGTPDVNGNLIGDPNAMGIIDPLLAPLADNGGHTKTHALLAGSPAMDMGDPSFSPPPEFDQRGAPFARVFGAGIDLGAYERHTGDMDFDGDVDSDDVDRFVVGLAFPLDYEQQYGAPPNANGDTDGDGDLDFDDIPGFVELLGGEPNPATTDRITGLPDDVGIVSVQTATETGVVATVPPLTQPTESYLPDVDIRRFSRREPRPLDEPGGGSSREGDVRDRNETVWASDIDWVRWRS